MGATRKLVCGCGGLLLVVLGAGCGGKADVAITAGPWLLRLDHEQVVVGWATSAIADGTLECWAVDEPHRARAHHPHRVTAHRLRVTGLRPATAYHYRIRSGRAKSPILAFTTLAAKLEKFTFAVYGGASHDLEQHAKIAKAIARADPAFVVYAGGYTKLTPDAEMADEAAMRARSLEPAAELLSSHALVPAAGGLMWGRTFTRLFPTRTGAPWYSYRLSLVEVFVLDPAAGLAAGGEQLEWLRNALRRSTAWWKFVVFHLPSLSGNPIIAHDDVRRALLPLLLRSGVDAVITGAAPRERSVPIRLASEPGGHALVCFSTSATPTVGGPRPMPWVAGGSADPHFLLVEVDAEKVTVTARDAQGREFDKAVLHKPGDQEQPEKAMSAEAIEAFLPFARPHIVSPPATGQEAWKETYSAEVANPYRTPIEGELRWMAPDESGWTIEPAVQKILVPPLETRTYSFTVTVQPEAPGPAPTFTFAAGDEELKARHSPFRLRKAK